jgi:tetratricopeptide (TPR) repeat protein
MLGVIFHQRGNHAEAVGQIDIVLKINPGAVEAHCNRGNALRALKRFEEALASYDQAIALKPDHAAAFYNRGNALRALKRFDEALASYDQAIALRPDHAEAFNNRGNALMELKRFDEALASYDKAIALKPDYAEVHYNRGNALKELKRFGEALASYDKAIALKPDHAAAFNNRGNALKELKRFGEALASYDQAIALKPDNAEIFNNRGNTLQEMKRLDEALASYDRAIAFKRDYAEVHYNRGNALKELKRCEEALASYDKALALRPDYAEAFNNRGIALQELKRLDEAPASYDQAIALKPDYVEAHSNRGTVLMNLGRPDEAEAAFRQAIALKPDCDVAHNNLGAVLREAGRLTEARRAVEQAILLAPRNVKYRCNLGQIVRFGVGDPHLAVMEQLANDSASLSVDDRIELHFALAKAYEEVGRHAEAFGQWLDGNALKRQHIAYNEAATLGAFDRVRAVFTAELVRTWQQQNVGQSSSVPVFIVGMPRSGTTLVEQILASHPQVFGGGELTHLHSAVEGIRTTFDSSLIFPELVQVMSDEDFRDLGARYLAEIKPLAPNAMRISNKMPGNFIFAGLIHLVLPNAPIIHVIRDPVDTCLSCFSILFSAEQNHTYDLAELGRYYRHYRALMAHWHGVLPAGRILDVRYEDVVADLEGQARRIIAHCGLDWNPRCLAFHQTERPVRTASATQVRQPIYNSSIGRWRVHEPFLGPLLAQLGIASDFNGNCS